MLQELQGPKDQRRPFHFFFMYLMTCLFSEYIILYVVVQSCVNIQSLTHELKLMQPGVAKFPASIKLLVITERVYSS